MVAERDMVEMRLREQVTALTAHRDSLQEQLQEQMQQMQSAQPGDTGAWCKAGRTARARMWTWMA